MIILRSVLHRRLAKACLLVAWLVPGVQAAIPDVVAGQPLPTLAPILDRVSPAVVNISTTAAVSKRNSLMDDPFFRQFFDSTETESAPAAQSLGSGVIVDAARGLVVTNNHVVEDAAEILITLSDGRETKAKVVGTDPQADIAVIKIDEPNLVEVAWADSSLLRVGDFCIAIGNPFGLGQTVTSGIVSAIGRSGLGIEDFEDFIQTDASINPGNSGGALINLRGELIGINTAIVGPGGGNVGIGFAIPSNMASDILEQLVEFGEVRRGALGIAAQPLTPELAEALDIDSRYGVVIGRIRSGSAADKAGLQVGDVITVIDGRPVRDISAVKNRIGLVRLGQRLQLKVLRDNVEINIDATVEELQFVNPLLEGAVFADEQTRRGRRFVVIAAVEPGSLFDDNGLQAGDIILSVNQRQVETVEQMESIAERNQENVLLLIQRGEATRYVRLRKG